MRGAWPASGSANLGIHGVTSGFTTHRASRQTSLLDVDFGERDTVKCARVAAKRTSVPPEPGLSPCSSRNALQQCGIYNRTLCDVQALSSHEMRSLST